MVALMTEIAAVFIGPWVVLDIINSIQLKATEKELHKLDRIAEIEQKYGVSISDEDLTMNARN